MLIEVRSSPDDSNNTPNQLFQRFNETLILKPRSKIALVSALITTSAAGGFRIDGTNQTIILTIGNAAQVSFDIAAGDYTLTTLAAAIQTGLRAAVVTSGQIYQDLFYADSDVTVAKSETDVVSITFKFDPQGFTGGNPTLVAFKNASVTATNIDLNSVQTGVVMRSREEINDGNVAIISKEVASGFQAVEAILPYANGAGTDDHTGIFEAQRMVTAPRVQHWGLSNSSGLAVGWWLLPSGNPYTEGGFQYRFDNYTGDNGYDWIVIQTVGTFYLTATDTYEFGVNTTDKVIDPGGTYDQTWTVNEEADGNLGVSITTEAGLVLTPLTLINRAGENNYDIWVNTNRRVQVRYNGTLLNDPTKTLLTDGDGIRWVVNALDNGTTKTKHPIPQIYHASVANPAWTEIPLNQGRSLPDYTEEDRLVPVYHADGLVASGTIGNGNADDTALTTSFLASDMGISAQVGSFYPGEILYPTGATTPAGGEGDMKLLSVVGTNAIGGATGALTSVLVLGNGYQGKSYANGMAWDVKGLKSGATATITINAVAAPIATITNGGTTYTQDNEYNFVLNTGGSPAQPPHPFTQNGRYTRGGKIKATAVGGGIITAVQFVDGGNGFCIGDTIEIQSNGGGDGAGDARITIQQVCEDVNQFVMSPTGCMDTYRVNGFFAPLQPQNTIDLNTGALGRSLSFTPTAFDGSVGAGVSQPIIASSADPTPNNPDNENILIDLPGIPIGSRNSGRQGNQTGGNTDNHIATIPYQTDLTKPNEFHKQHYEPFNMIYHSMDNEADLNLNAMSVRLTNFDGTLRTDIAHPTQLTFSIQPDYM